MGADCSDWTVLTLWNSLHENVLCDQLFNLLRKGSACFDHPDYWMNAICLTKLLKTAFCPRYVSLLKKQRFIVLCTSAVMYKKYKRLAYTSRDLLARFCKAKLVEHKKIRLQFYSGLPFRQRNATYKLQRVNRLPPRTILSYNQTL